MGLEMLLPTLLPMAKNLIGGFSAAPSVAAPQPPKPVIIRVPQYIDRPVPVYRQRAAQPAPQADNTMLYVALGGAALLAVVMMQR